MKFLFLFLSLIHFLYGNNPFNVGEILEYNASFAGINAAKAQLKVLEKKEIGKIMTYHVQFTAKSSGLTNYIFPINDRIDLWLDENSLFTIKKKSNIQEGKYSYSNEIIFNHSINQAYTENDTINIEKGTHTPYSLFYYFRKLNLEKITKTTLKTIQKKKITTLEVLIEKNIKTVVPAGTFLCTKVTPQYSNKKKFKNESQISILFSNNEQHYPVKIWLKLKYGVLLLELQNIVN